MRRYIFYLSIALLAFGVSSVVVFKFYRNADEQIITAPKFETIESSSGMKIEKLITEESAKIKIFNEYRFVCEDEELEVFWLNFLKEKDIQEELPKDGNYGNAWNCSERIDVKRFDLNGDGSFEYIVGLIGAYTCGSKGNCPRMLYEQKNGKFNRLLSHKASLFFETRNKQTKGYKNLKMFFSSGIYGGYVENYIFNGKEYKLKGCFQEWTDGSLERVKCWNLNK